VGQAWKVTKGRHIVQWVFHGWVPELGPLLYKFAKLLIAFLTVFENAMNISNFAVNPLS